MSGAKPGGRWNARSFSASVLLGLGLWLLSGAPQDQVKATGPLLSEIRAARPPALEPQSSGAEALLRVMAGYAHHHASPRADVLAARPLLHLTAAALPSGPVPAAGGAAFDIRHRIAANIQRLEDLPPEAPSTYVLVNIPQARLWMVRDGRVEGTMRVVVGRPDQPTPQMRAHLTHIILNPRWHVPQDLVRTNLAPEAAKTNGRSLAAKGYEVMSSWADDALPVPPSRIDWGAVMAGRLSAAVRQKPGPGNMMGEAKFVMPNDQGVYLHDTPYRDLFASERRTASAGCIRLEDHERLITFLLQGRLTVPPPRGKPTYVKLAEPAPVFVTYVTAIPSAEGVRLLDDPYGLDGDGGERLARRDGVGA